MKRSIFIAFLFGLIMAALIMVKAAGDIKIALSTKAPSKTIQMLEKLK